MQVWEAGAVSGPTWAPACVATATRHTAARNSPACRLGLGLGPMSRLGANGRAGALLLVLPTWQRRQRVDPPPKAGQANMASQAYGLRSRATRRSWSAAASSLGLTPTDFEDDDGGGGSYGRTAHLHVFAAPPTAEDAAAAGVDLHASFPSRADLPGPPVAAQRRRQVPGRPQRAAPCLGCGRDQSAD